MKSSQAKHTPGPWSSGPHHRTSSSGLGQGYYVNTVADVEEWGTQDDGSPRMMPQRICDCYHANARANATLIAAAPAMLEALEAIQNLQPLPTATATDLSLAIGEIRRIACDAIANTKIPTPRQ